MDQQDLRQLARIGAASRLAELDQERAMLLRAFPGLRAPGRSGRTGSQSDGVQTAAPGRKRRRRKMSAAARKRISDAQKARWAKLRAKKA
jgi:hypothetical protein